MNIEWGKLAVLGSVIAGCFGCIMTGTAEFMEVLPVLTGITGYIYGNGRLASKGEPSVPVISASSDAQVETIVQRIKDAMRPETNI